MPYAIAVIAIFVAAVLLFPRLDQCKSRNNRACRPRHQRLELSLLWQRFSLFGACLPMAVPLFLFGLFLLGAQRGFNRTNKSTGQKSSVRTSILDMWLNHDDGSMDGAMIVRQLYRASVVRTGTAGILQLLGECVSARRPERSSADGVPGSRSSKMARAGRDRPVAAMLRDR